MKQSFQRYCLALGGLMSKALVSILILTGMIVFVNQASAATVTAKAETGGSIVPSGTITVEDGTTQQFGVVAKSGYKIAGVAGCNGRLAETRRGYVYTTGRVSGICVVTATFKPRAPSILMLKINNDAAETKTQSVTLTFSLSADSTPTRYRASERADFEGVAWKALSGNTAALPFELSVGAGLKTVYLQLMDERSIVGGISNVMSDTISLQARQFYNIAGRDFYGAARSAGFVSRADRATTNTCTCIILEGPADSLPANQVAARVVGSTNCYSNYSSPACDFIFFDGKLLKNSFVFKGLEGVQYPIVAGCGMTLVSTPAVGSTSIKIRLQEWTNGGTECQYIIEKMILEGPANTDWRTALGAKP